MDFEKEVCFVIVYVAFSSLTCNLDVRDLQSDKLARETSILSPQSESQIRR